MGLERREVVAYFRTMLYFIGPPKWCQAKPWERPVSSASLGPLFVGVLACLYIHFSAVFCFVLFFWNFPKKVYISCWWVLLSSDSYQSIFLLWAFYIYINIYIKNIYSIQYGTHLFTAKRLSCQLCVHKCKEKWQVCKTFVTSVITLNIQQTHFGGRDLLLLHSFLVNY